MFVTDPIRCAENIADSLKSHNVSANQINLVAQDDVNLILFCFYSAESDATIIGSYFLRLRDRKRSRATTVRDTVMSSDAKSSSSVVLLCQLPGKMDIVHMSVDSRLLQLLSVVYSREINGKTIYFVDLIDRLKFVAGDHSEKRFPINLNSDPQKSSSTASSIVKTYFLRRQEGGGRRGNQNPVFYLLVMVLGVDIYLYKIASCELVYNHEIGANQCRILRNKYHRVQSPTNQSSISGYVWAQWDSKHQRVFILTLNREMQPSSDFQMDSCLSLEGREYRAVDTPDHVKPFLNTPLLGELNGKITLNVFGNRLKFVLRHIAPTDASSGDRNPMMDCLSYQHINARLLAQGNGTLTLCMQIIKPFYEDKDVLSYAVVSFHHLIVHEVFAHGSSHAYGSPDDDQQRMSTFVHVPERSGASIVRNSAKTPDTPTPTSGFAKSVSREVLSWSEDSKPGDMANPNRILFILFDHYVIAMLSQSFIHMLDNGDEHAPSHSIYLSSNQLPAFAKGHMHMTPFRLGPTRRPLTFFFDLHAQTLHQMSIDHSGFLKLFTETPDEKMRVALLHYAFFHSNKQDISEDSWESSLSGTVTQDAHSLERPIMSLIADDIQCIETTNLLAEMIACTAYKSFAGRPHPKQVQNLVKMFPYTSAASEADIANRDSPQYLFSDKLKPLNLEPIEDKSDGAFANVISESMNSSIDNNSASEERKLVVTVACTRIPQIADYFSVRCVNQRLFTATAKLIEKAKHENAKRTLNDNNESNWRRLKNGRLSFKYLSTYSPNGSPPKNRGKFQPRNSMLSFLKYTKDDRKCPMLWFRINSFIRELSDLKKNTASSKFYTENKDALVEMCEVYCSHLMDQVISVLEQFWELCEMGTPGPYNPPKNDQQGVIAPKVGLKTLGMRAESKERLLLECFLKTQIAMESIGFDMPNGYWDFAFALGIRSYSLSYFSAMLNGGVFKLSAHACRRVFEELDEKKRKKKASSVAGPGQDEILAAGGSSLESDQDARNEVYSFKHDILLRYDSMCPLADLSTVVNWEPGKQICQEMALMKKLSDVTGYFDKGPVPTAPNPFPALNSSSGSLGGSESSESYDKSGKGDSGGESSSAAAVDLVSEARSNFKAYISSKLGKNAHQYFANAPPPRSSTQFPDDSLWFYL